MNMYDNLNNSNDLNYDLNTEMQLRFKLFKIFGCIYYYGCDILMVLYF